MSTTNEAQGSQRPTRTISKNHPEGATYTRESERPRRVDAPPVFDGGTDQDHEELLAVHNGFLSANDPLDADKLRQVWSASTDNVFFNTNGYTYYGLEDWLKVWDFYRPQAVLVQPYTPGDVRIVVRGDMALITSDWIGRYKDRLQQNEDRFDYRFFRSTQVCTRDNGRWEVIHAHFSPRREGARPEQRNEDQE